MKNIAKEIIQMAKTDLAVRERLLSEGKLFEGYHPEMESVHRTNAARLREIITLIGWPTRSKVGEEASEAAWLIVQHSIGEASFMRDCYVLMQDVAGDINPHNLAYLYDRICYFEGRPQRYGTQYDVPERMYPVENKHVVNHLREELGMTPVPEERIVEQNSGNSPINSAPDEWRRKAGWIN
ncbi:hypothetical protein GCM10028807_50660 [Spirosoma daeguense]